MARRRRRSSPFWSQPLDRWAISLILTLLLAITGLILSGDHATAEVRSFSWQDHKVGAEDRAFLLTFSRPMDPTSVERNLTINPALPGKFSWAGRRMAYTLDQPVPYGQAFTVSLPQAQDRFGSDHGQVKFQSFEGQFQTRERGFLYIGRDGDEAGRLVLADLTRQERTILTPKELVVLAFKPYPLGDQVLVTATDAAGYASGNLNQQLYRVTTGFNPNPPVDLGAPPPGLWSLFRRQPTTPRPSGELDLVLDSQNYQNLKFDLSPDGRTIVVQRLSRTNPDDLSPWILRDGQPPKPLKTGPGGDFMIGPDSQSLIMLQGEGTAIIDLNSEAETTPHKPLDFLPDYGQVFDVKRDGSAAAMVNFNQNDPDKQFTQSLFLVTNLGEETQLLQVSGAILDAKFDPMNRTIYVLASEVLVTADTTATSADAISDDGNTYVEQPFLTAINLKDQTRNDLLLLPPQQTIHISLAPDGLAMLLDLEPIQPEQIKADQEQPPNHPVWLLPLFANPTERLTGTPSKSKPEAFPFQGINATWLP